VKVSVENLTQRP